MKGFDELERSHYPTVADLIGPKAIDPLTIEENSPLRGAEKATNHTKERRLPGAVWPDETNDLPVVNREGDSVYRSESAKRACDLAQLE
jgi:hypothetical protein